MVFSVLDVGGKKRYEVFVEGEIRTYYEGQIQKIDTMPSYTWIDLDTNTDVAVYVKLPDGFYISTPVGRYNPDWAIAFYGGKVKHIYFVAETKGSMNSMQPRLIRDYKECNIRTCLEYYT